MSSPDDDLRRAAERYKFEIDRHRGFYIEALNKLIIEGEKKQELIIECEKKQELIDKLHIDMDCLAAQKVVDTRKLAAMASEIGDTRIHNVSLQQSLAESGALLEQWQTWWSRTMRPAVVHLVASAGRLTDRLYSFRDEIAPALQTFPATPEFPVGPVKNTIKGAKHEET